MTIIDAVILGIIQGLTEFMPVSSSGHLVLAEHFLKILKNGISFEVFVHFGTFLSVIAVFWKDIWEILKGTFGIFNPKNLNTIYIKENEQFKLGVWIILGTIPAGIAGILLEKYFEAAFSNPLMVSKMLLITGAILFLTRFAKPTTGKRVGWLSAILIGCAQAIAIMPGISRSGSTISAAMYMKIEPERAVRFSFLLSLPVIFGATILKFKDLVSVGFSQGEGIVLLVGTIVSAIAGFIAIKLTLKIASKGKFNVFAYYCFIIGALGIIFI